MNVTMAEERREVGVAEKMMVGKNYVGAREKLIKALQSSPPTDNANQMMTVCDILSAASIKFPNFGIDYYWVLQLSPLCSESDVNYRYQKLVKALQPSRYKIHGAPLAGKLIREAFAVLSDPLRRGAYDVKRADTREGYRSFNMQTSVYYNSSDVSMETTLQSSTASRIDGQGSTSGGNLTAVEVCPEVDVTKQEPSQASENTSSRENVEAENNKSSEMSTAMDSDPSLSSKTSDKSCDQDFYDFEKEKQNEKFEIGEIWACSHQANVVKGRRYARVDNNSNTDSSLVVTWLKPKPISAGERRWCEAGLPVACGSFEIDPELRGRESWPMVLAYKCSWVDGMTDEQFEIYPKRGEVWAVYKDWDLDRLADSPEDVKRLEFDFIELLSDFSKYLGADGAYLAKVDNFRNIFERKLSEENHIATHIHPEDLFMFSHRVPAYRFEGGELDGVMNGMIELDRSAMVTENCEPNQVKDELEEEDSERVSFTHTELPAPLNTYSEDQFLSPRWSKYDFSPGQVWAFFCSEDYMPRSYALVEAVVSENQVSVTLLDPAWVADSEHRPTAANVAAYGIYKLSEASLVMDMSRFSHLAKCQKSSDRQFYKVCPRKGEIWALYENWNHRWKQPEYITSQYGVVEILTEFADGVIIAKLEEVKGCLTFYNRQEHDGFQLTHMIPKYEQLRFSHQIPAFKVPGIGMYRIPEEAWHLEPSALPPKI
uniref:J domain-containing protein n=1 Tax=Kalanchoe fedtschenkoi TaxID=63787 RepID=A0A7N1A928_KALFE